MGGSMSIAQMMLQASNTDDWSGFIGNPWKVGTGLFTVIFDLIFMFQHYVLYHPKKEEIEICEVKK
jgi:cystinosin